MGGDRPMDVLLTNKQHRLGGVTPILVERCLQVGWYLE